jgi:hypothetical protein
MVTYLDKTYIWIDTKFIIIKCINRFDDYEFGVDPIVSFV